MAWYTFAAVAVLITLVTAYVAPGIARSFLSFVNSVKFIILALVAPVLIFYSLTSGSGVLIAIAMVSIGALFLEYDPLGLL